MPEQLVFSVTESSQVGEVRRAARKLAEQSGLSETRKSAAAIIATELATNIVSHAGQGQILLAVANGPGSVCLDLLAFDSGPGMVDVQRCLQDGYSTSGTPGNGLGAVRRLADEFDLFSNRDQGTVVMARLHAGNPVKHPPPVVQFAISTPVAGETVCGDAWRSSFLGAQFALMVVDGLGHGRGAHEAATRAVESFESGPSANPEQMLDTAHRALYGSRGAALAVAKVDFNTQRLSFAGVGNISGLLITAAGSKGLTSHNGILGAQKPRFQQFEYEWTSPALLILHSDGLQTRWRMDKYPGLQQRHPGVVAGVLYRDFLRGHDDATIAVARLSQNG